MTEKRNHSNPHPAPEAMLAYLRDELDPRAAHELEKHLLDCELCTEALEGLHQQDPESLLTEIEGLKNSIRKRIRPSHTYRTYGIAAAIVLLIAATFVVINYQTEKILPGPDVSMQSAEEEAPAVAEVREDSIVSKEKITSETLISEQIEPAEVASPASGSAEFRDEANPQTDDADQAETDTQTGQLEEEMKNPDLAFLDSREADAETEAEPVQPDNPGPVSGAGTKSSFKAEEASGEELNQAVATRTKDARNMKKSAPRPTLATTNTRNIVGSVYSYDELEPLPGVNVVLKGTTQGTVTDANGNFSLLLPPGENSLVVSYTGFVSEEFTIDESSDSIEIAMDTDIASISEVAGTGFLDDDEHTRSIPQPGIGRKAYRKYLEENLRYPPEALEKGIEGKVLLRVIFNEFGIIRNIEVSKGLGYGCDEEAIRLVKEGPAWEPGKIDGEPVDMEYTIRIKFNLEE